MNKKRLLVTILAIILGILLLVLVVFIGGKVKDSNTSSSTASKEKTVKKIEENVAYLFVYFTGNNPAQEKISFSVSTDGYNFRALNFGKPVLSSNVGTKCTRDPFIFKGEDGFYYMLATDMKSSLGWDSNRNLASWKSKDLVNWTDESLIEIADKYKSMMTADRVWAPQAIYDPDVKEYMIYWAARLRSDVKHRTLLWYAYTKDFKTLTSEPKLLYAPSSGNDAIDGDIYFKDGTYYMYYKDETSKGIKLTTSKHAAGPYDKQSIPVSPQGLGVEGPNIYKLINQDKWLLLSDAYGNGYFVMQETTDLRNFTQVKRTDYTFNFSPRHGYVIPITQSQYDALLKAYPNR